MLTSPTSPKSPSSQSLPPSDAKARVSEFMKQLQDEISQSLAEIDGTGQ